MTASGPEMAVVVMSLRAQRGLGAAVASILAQQPTPEVVVVDSGGGDPAAVLGGAAESVEIVAAPGRLLPGAARNVGIRVTSAPFVAFLAADCVADPGWVANRLRRHHAGALAVSSAVAPLDETNRFSAATQVLLFARRSPRTPRPLWVHYGVSYARELFESRGAFREDLRTGEDTEFHGRLGDEVPILAARDVVTRHRHPTGPFGFVGDQFARGRRSERAWRRLGDVDSLATAGPRGLRRARALSDIAAMRADGEELEVLGRAAPWVRLGAVAYEAGRFVGRTRTAPRAALDARSA